MVDYAYYTDIFKGVAVPSPALFNSLEVRAAAYVKKATFGRITEVTDDIKNAVCAAAEVYAGYAGREGKASENNDGYSVSYTDSKMLNSELLQAVTMFLPDGLLYRGLS